MFYSRDIFSKKGSLGAIWVAAYFSKKLKRSQISQTDISSSVENILRVESDEVTYRMLAQLLLGIVRIYSKQVEFFFSDCNRVLLMVKDFPATQNFDSLKRTFSSSCSSITIPKTFELDSFELEIIGDTYCENVASVEDITLNDNIMHPWKRQRLAFKDASEKIIDSWDESGFTFDDKVEEKFQSNAQDTNFSDWENFYNAMSLESEIEIRDTTNEFSCDNISEPIHQDNNEASIQDNDQSRRKSIEKDVRFKTSDTVPVNVDETENFRQVFDSEYQEDEQMLSSNKFADKHQNIETDHLVHTNEDVNVNITTPEISATATPLFKENSPTSRKRKFMFDNVTVLSNRILKQQLEDTSDLVREAKKFLARSPVSDRYFHTSKLSKFLEPLIPYKSSLIESLFDLEKEEYIKTDGNSNQSEVLMSECCTTSTAEIGSSNKQKMSDRDENEDPIEKFLRPSLSISPTREYLPAKHGESTATDDPLFVESLIAPTTPVITMKSLKVVSSPEDDETSNGTPMNCQNMDEDLCFSCEGFQFHEEDNLSGRSENTRYTMRYLNQIFTNGKEIKADKAVNLSQTLDGKTRKECAIFFHDILVLSTIGYVTLKQKEPYGDILLQKSPQWDNI